MSYTKNDVRSQKKQLKNFNKITAKYVSLLTNSIIEIDEQNTRTMPKSLNTQFAINLIPNTNDTNQTQTKCNNYTTESGKQLLKPFDHEIPENKINDLTCQQESTKIIIRFPNANAYAKPIEIEEPVHFFGIKRNQINPKRQTKIQKKLKKLSNLKHKKMIKNNDKFVDDNNLHKNTNEQECDEIFKSCKDFESLRLKIEIQKKLFWRDVKFDKSTFLRMVKKIKKGQLKLE